MPVRTIATPPAAILRLLRTTCLVPPTTICALAMLTAVASPVSANGGGGGIGTWAGSGGPPGTGGVDNATGTGGAGAAGGANAGGGGAGGGGGGAGIVGGLGGAGGAGAFGSDGGAGGAGGNPGYVGATLPGGSITGQAGGNGADGLSPPGVYAGGGGGGGAGGYGAIIIGNGANGTVWGSISGGVGGTGGGSRGRGGDGGSGGTGLFYLGSGTDETLTIGASGSVTGGTGGSGGSSWGCCGERGAGGSGGVGLIGMNLSIINNGLIRGGDNHAGSNGFAGVLGLIGTNLSVTNNGLILGGDGNQGIDGSLAFPGGVGGTGGRGAAAISGTALTIANQGTIQGGKGGNSGSTTSFAGAGASGARGGEAIFGTNLSVSNGGLLLGGDGGNGGATSSSFQAGGNGGAGGSAISGSGSSIVNNGTIRGGKGGNGGSSGSNLPWGIYLGSGGNGGDAISATGLTITNTGLIQGGDGGTGGLGTRASGAPGIGGAGISGSNLTIFQNGGAIQGGNGDPIGYGGVGISGSNLTIVQNGGAIVGTAGIVGSNLTIVQNGGTIASTLSRIGFDQASAIVFSGGVNTLTFGTARSGLEGGIFLFGSLTFAQPTDVIVDSSVLGLGTLTKTGAGKLTFSNTVYASGTISLEAGSLIVNREMGTPSSVTVAAGATLGGSGIVTSTILHGTLSPGDSSVGTLTITDFPGVTDLRTTLVFERGSSYLAEVQGATADRIDVFGTARLAGTLRLVPLGGPYRFNSPYTLLSASGGYSGTFERLESLFGDGVGTTVGYAANSVLLTFLPERLSQFATTLNSSRIAGAIDQSVVNGADPSALFGIYDLPAAVIPAAVNQLSGEAHAGVPAMANSAATGFLGAMLDPFAAGRRPEAAGPGAAAYSGLVRKGVDEPATPSRLDAPLYTVWGAAFGSHGRSEGSARIGATRREVEDVHLAVGADLRLAPDTVVGVALAGGKASATLAGKLGKADAEIFQAGLHGSTRLGPVRLGAALAYTRLENEVDRTIPALGSTVSASYAATAWSGRLEASVALFDWNGFGISPLAAVQASQVRSPAVIETSWTGQAAGALALARRVDLTTRSELGFRIDAATSLNGIALNGFVKAAWAHYTARDAELTASLIGLPGASFIASGARPDRNSVLVTAGLEARMSERVSLGLKLDGEVSGSARRLAAAAQVKVSF